MVGDDERLVDEATHQDVDVAYADSCVADRVDGIRAHRLDGLQRRSSAECGKPAEQRPLPFVEEIVAPVDEVAQRLLSHVGRARPD